MTTAHNPTTAKKMLTSCWLLTLGASYVLPLFFGSAGQLSIPLPTIPVAHSAFSWPWFCLYACVAASCVPWLFHHLRASAIGNSASLRPGAYSAATFTLLVVTWYLAWSRAPWFSPLQRYTFAFVWASYNLFANALLRESGGKAPLFSSTRAYLLAFPVSSAFWWVFEHLNRFVQNWHYVVVGPLSSFEYVAFASISFSTVLPSIWVTHNLLARFFSTNGTTTIRLSKGLANLILAIGTISLLFIPLLPDVLFATVWIAPLCMVLALNRLIAENSLSISQRDVALWSLSGLSCGMLWELWNFYSQEKWIYTVPYVQRFHIFEMPLLGYVGYLPFGLLCGLAILSLQQLCSRSRT